MTGNLPLSTAIILTALLTLFPFAFMLANFTEPSNKISEAQQEEILILFFGIAFALSSTTFLLYKYVNNVPTIPQEEYNTITTNV